MLAWIQSHFQVLILIALPIYNIVMSAVAQIFIKLGKLEPEWLQWLSKVGLKATQYLSANTPSPQPQVVSSPASDQKSVSL